VQADLGAVTKSAPCTTWQEFVEVSRDCHAVAAGDFPISRPIIEQMDQCLVIAKIGVGVDPVDLVAAREYGIRVTHVPDYGMEDVASHAFALLLALTRHLFDYDRIVRSGSWDKMGGGTIYRVRGRTIGILGLGRIGKTFARQVRGMECRVIAHDPYLTPDVFAAHGVEPVGLDTLLEESDFLSLHVPLTHETRHIIDARALSRMKPTAFLVNTSRGGVVDTEAICHALATGQIAGAGLDVHEEEPPPPDSPLFTTPHLILTPHAAWYSEDSRITMATRVAEEISRALRGMPARCPVVDVPLRRLADPPGGTTSPEEVGP